MESFLRKKSDYWCFFENYEAWRQRYGRIWKRNIDNAEMTGQEKAACMSFLEAWIGMKVGEITAEDEIYYEEARVVEP